MKNNITEWHIVAEGKQENINVFRRNLLTLDYIDLFLDKEIECSGFEKNDTFSSDSTGRQYFSGATDKDIKEIFLSPHQNIKRGNKRPILNIDYTNLAKDAKSLDLKIELVALTSPYDYIDDTKEYDAINYLIGSSGIILGPIHTHYNNEYFKWYMNDFYDYYHQHFYYENIITRKPLLSEPIISKTELENTITESLIYKEMDRLAGVIAKEKLKELSEEALYNLATDIVDNNIFEEKFYKALKEYRKELLEVHIAKESD